MKCDKCKKDFPRDEIKEIKHGLCSAKYYCDDCYFKQRNFDKILTYLLLMGFFVFFIAVILMVLI